jgi:hypothetical protein
MPLLESGRGLPHSKTLTRAHRASEIRQVLDCGSPLPLFHGRSLVSSCHPARGSHEARRHIEYYSRSNSLRTRCGPGRAALRIKVGRDFRFGRDLRHAQRLKGPNESCEVSQLPAEPCAERRCSRGSAGRFALP